jgi:hypothetical protein
MQSLASFERRKTDPGPGHRGVTALQPVRDFFSNQHLVIVDHRMLRMAARNGAVYGNCKNAPARSTRAISTRGIQAREVPLLAEKYQCHQRAKGKEPGF